MRLLNLLSVLGLHLTLGFSDITIQYSVDYFNYRNVKFVCLLTCDDIDWTAKFTKRASAVSIAVSHVKIDSRVQNYNAIDKCLKRKFTSIGVYINTECSQFENSVEFASQNQYFDATHKWLFIKNKITNVSNNNDTNEVNNIETNSSIDSITTRVNTTSSPHDDNLFMLNYNFNNNETDDVYRIFDNLNLSVDTDVIVSAKRGFSSYDLYDIFNFGKTQGGSLSINHAGSWNVDTDYNLKIDLNSYKYYRRWDFQELPIKMIAVMAQNTTVNLDVMFGRKPVPECPDISRIPVMIMRSIAELHNISFIYKPASKWIDNFGHRNSGVIATELYYKEQDVAPGIRLLESIFEKIDFLYPPLHSIETKFYYRIPTTGPGKYENQFLRPLTKSVWYCVIAIISLCGILLLITSKIEGRSSGVQYALFSVLASFCQQFFDCGIVETNRLSSAREITMLVTGLSSLLIYNYYTSSVVSWLLNGPPPSINSLEELLDSPLELVLQDIGYAKSWLQVPTYYFNKRNAKVEDEMRQKKVFNKKKGAPLLVTLEKGIEFMKAGGYAFHAEVTSANELISRQFTQEELCELGSLVSIDKTPLYPAVQKNSPYKELFTWSLTRLKERGVVSCLQRRTQALSVTCEGSSPRALALGGAAPAFLLLVFGYMLATLILVLERFAMRQKSRRRK